MDTASLVSKSPMLAGIEGKRVEITGPNRDVQTKAQEVVPKAVDRKTHRRKTEFVRFLRKRANNQCGMSRAMFYRLL
jgi:hypothetical protein